MGNGAAQLARNDLYNPQHPSGQKKAHSENHFADIRPGRSTSAIETSRPTVQRRSTRRNTVFGSSHGTSGSSRGVHCGDAVNTGLVGSLPDDWVCL